MNLFQDMEFAKSREVLLAKKKKRERERAGREARQG